MTQPIWKVDIIKQRDELLAANRKPYKMFCSHATKITLIANADMRDVVCVATGVYYLGLLIVVNTSMGYGQFLVAEVSVQ